MNITQEQLKELLMEVQKPTFINVVMETEVRMNKTGNPYYGLVKKITSGNYLIGNSYENRVRNNEVKEGMEGDFVSETPKGKEHVSLCVLVDTKTRSTYYLMMERFDEIHPQVNYVMNGDPIEKELFESYMTKVYESQKQEQERKVMVITPKLSNIKHISIDNMKYDIIPQEVGIENEMIPVD